MDALMGIELDDLLVLVAVLAVYAVFAKVLARWWISAALFFTVVGWLAGPAALGWFQSQVGSSSVELLASVALATVLFGDATKVRLASLLIHAAAPTRLLTIGLLGTVILGALVAYPLLGGITWPIALVLAVILAPTDAALGASVVSNPQVPPRIREALFVESGLNDGLAVPILVLALAWAGLEDSSMGIAGVLLMKVGLSTLLGIGLGLLSYALLRVARRWGGQDGIWGSLLPLLTALACYFVAEHVGASGFIAAFVGGMTFGGTARAQEEQGIEVDEAVSSLLQGVTWFLFGALAFGPIVASGAVQWTWIVYAVLSLTVIRMVPVALALAGTGTPRRAVLFMGWFGPRGLASVVFLMLVLGLNPTDSDAAVIAGVATITVVMSVVLHGLTAPPLSSRLSGAASPAGRGR
jgi:NhaP-type Na+/H+ or K+/H+ antiporter